MKHDDSQTMAPFVAIGLAVPRRLLGLKSAAEYVSLSYWTIRSLIWNGNLPSVRVGRRILVDRHDLDAFVEQHKQLESLS